MVSVIVPVYNNTRYLKECIDSLLAQTYYDVELILVDDGSDDDCARLCDSFRDVAAVYHKPNGGVSSARNLGLEKVRGEYVCFVDSDDVISPRYIETLVEMCERNDVPLAACAFQPFSDTIPTPAEPDGLYLLSDPQGTYLRIREARFLRRFFTQNQQYARKLP